MFRLKGWEWFFLGFAVGLIVLSTFLDLSIPNYIAQMTAEIQKGSGAQQSYIWLRGGMMLALAVSSALVMITNNYIFAVLSSRIIKRLRSELFDKVNAFGDEEIKKFSVASLLTRLTNDAGQVRMFFATAIQMLVKAPMMAVGAGLMILTKSNQLSMATFAATGLLLVVVSIVLIIVMPRLKVMQRRTDEINLASRETLTGIRVIRAYNAEKFQEDKFNAASAKLAGTGLVVDRFFGLIFPFTSLLMCMLGLANWWIGSALMERGAVEQVGFFSQIMVFTQYSVQIIMSFVFLIHILLQMPRALVSARRIGEVIGTNSTIVDGIGGKTARERERARLEQENRLAELEQLENPLAIQFNGVNFRYPSAEGFVLKGINLDIKQGERVAFIGVTGCGKSTLVNLIPRLYDATEGEIKLFGMDIKHYRLRGIRKRVAYIPQRAMLFHGTVRENVVFGEGMAENITDDDIWRALEIAQAKDFVSKLDGGLDFVVAQNGDNLSGGQKQRIAIARGIIRDPKIYIFDDTFSALDFETDARLRHALASSMKDTTQIVVAQRIGTVKNMDRIVVLEDGVIVGNGTHKELLKNCRAYKDIAVSQLSAEELK